MPTENDFWDRLPFRAKVLSFAFRLKWYVTRRCWAHNDTCTHCTKHGFCKLRQPGLIRIEGTWCCSSYDWDIAKMFKKYVVGKRITIKVDKVETLAKGEHDGNEVL